MTGGAALRGRHDWQSVAELLRSRMPDSKVLTGAPLGALSTYRVGGSAGALIEVGSERDLQCLAAASASESWEILIVGLGSNLLVADAGFNGLSLRLGAAFAGVRIVPPAVIAGAATPLPILARQCAGAGLGGFAWAVGVPGSIGGAVRMNAGGHGSDMRQVVHRAEVLDLASGESISADLEYLALGYRSSALHSSQVVVEVELSLHPSDRQREERLIRDIVRWRRQNQPGGANTGSVFRNPPGDFAGQLVEAAGCKGLRLGSATVSEIHANFIQADPGGTADDVLSLMREVARRVELHSGVRLRPETHLVGFDEPFRSSK